MWIGNFSLSLFCCAAWWKPNIFKKNKSLVSQPLNVEKRKQKVRGVEINNINQWVALPPLLLLLVLRRRLNMNQLRRDWNRPSDHINSVTSRSHDYGCWFLEKKVAHALVLSWLITPIFSMMPNIFSQVSAVTPAQMQASSRELQTFNWFYIPGLCIYVLAALLFCLRHNSFSLKFFRQTQQHSRGSAALRPSTSLRFKHLRRNVVKRTDGSTERPKNPVIFKVCAKASSPFTRRCV